MWRKKYFRFDNEKHVLLAEIINQQEKSTKKSPRSNKTQRKQKKIIQEKLRYVFV